MNVVNRLLNRWRAAAAPKAATSAPLRAEALPAGTVLDRIRIERAIARGASGTLYAGIDEATDQAVAVKVMCLPHTGSDDRAGEEARARFLHDAEQAGRLFRSFRKVTCLFKSTPTPILNTDQGNPIPSFLQIPTFIQQKIKTDFTL